MDDLKTFKKYFNRDFWRAFQNRPSLFEIPLTKANKDTYIERLYKKIQERKYYPSVPRFYIDIDKGNGVTRIVPVFSLKDYCVYYYCIKKIEDKIAYNRIANTFGGWTLGGLMRKSEVDEMEKRRRDYNRREDFMAELHGISVSQYSFNPAAWTRAYGDLNAKLYATAKGRKYHFVAELDIANYYDSIRLDILEMRIREIVNGEHADIVSLLFHFLNYWNRNTNLYNKQTVGIPQDAMGDCSRILANFYLQPYDKYVFELCKENKCKYLRYADDQFLFAEDEKKLKLLIFKVSKKLNALGLSVNQKKVKVRSTEELIDNRAFKIFDMLKDDADREDKNQVEQFVDCYLDLLEQSGLKNIKDNGQPMLSRALFCPALSKIDSAKKKRLLSCYLNDEYLKKAKVMHLKKIYQLLPKSKRPEFINKLNSLSGKLIHNAFHYELQNFFNNHGIDTRRVNMRIKKLSTI